MAALKQWRPINSAHAIQQVIARVRFSQDVNEIPWRRILTLGKDRARALGLNVEQPVQDVNVTMSPSGPPVQSIREVGVEHLRLERPGFASDKLLILKSEISFEEWRYTRWAALAEKLGELFLPLTERYMDSVTISAIQLEYIDMFEAAPASHGPDCSELIRENSEFTSPVSYSKTNPWHCHSGFFTSPDAQTKRLCNIDIDVADINTGTTPTGEDPVRVARIRTHLTDFFNQKGYPPLSNESFEGAAIIERFEALHVSLKQTFGKIITDQAAAAVSMKG
ncbi:uncharacterized protein (TIGR04255 family) [Rhizobium subbaraonis]|uniref:Uncharacterized protein (TIGR04255 family) n=1 Tax=Rhizobium subbaraonis TaxID=908946 RepID=A0A285UZ93_9HYPH|nr:TIGR04255 family protein [Rhizobium subbaraonis]SOC47140.1 uncharacterized protein (TIGR04255 family) [Rhizobium subbaraonis]